MENIWHKYFCRVYAKQSNDAWSHWPQRDAAVICSLRKSHFKFFSEKRRSFCLGLNVLNHYLIMWLSASIRCRKVIITSNMMISSRAVYDYIHQVEILQTRTSWFGNLDVRGFMTSWIKVQLVMVRDYMTDIDQIVNCMVTEDTRNVLCLFIIIFYSLISSPQQDSDQNKPHVFGPWYN